MKEGLAWCKNRGRAFKLYMTLGYWANQSARVCDIFPASTINPSWPYAESISTRVALGKWACICLCSSRGIKYRC